MSALFASPVSRKVSNPTLTAVEHNFRNLFSLFSEIRFPAPVLSLD